MAKVETVERLRELYRLPGERPLRKQLPKLDRHCERFIALSPFCLLGTADGEGGVDVSPRGDGPGFVQVLDAGRIALPDRPGNNRLDSLQNIIADPAVGLLFLIPGVQETLRINGDAEIRDDDDLRQRFAVKGRLPATVLVVNVREAFLHCAKSLMRSALWDPNARIDRAELPSMNEMIRDQTGETGADGVETQDEMVARYRETLY